MGLRKRDREAAPSVKVCPHASPRHLAPRRYAATAGMYLHHLSAGRSRWLRGSCRSWLLPPALRKQEQGQAQSLQDLIALGHQRGYKNPVAWAKHLLAARQTKSQWSKIK
jgi:hypothetical protein